MFSGCMLLHAPPYRCAISSRPPYRLRCCKVPMANSARIAIVGDVHDDWSLEEDTKALQLLKPDLVMFTGRCSVPHLLCDFGNENVDLVESISKLDFSKAIILGNHDAWNTQKFSAREKDAVQLQLEFLGDEHVGYGRIDFPNLKLSIVGGRPFSCGGEHLFRKKLLTASTCSCIMDMNLDMVARGTEVGPNSGHINVTCWFCDRDSRYPRRNCFPRYGVHNMDESAKMIYEAALGTPADHSIIFLAHNGPSGLGSNWMISVEGIGFLEPETMGILTTKLQIKLVVFGHMHKNLAYGQGLRKMIAIGDDNIIYLNGAVVPRVKPMGKEQANYAMSSNPEKTSAMTSNLQGTKRAFTIADISNGNLEKVAETWVSVIGEQVTIEDELIIFSKAVESSKHSSCSAL
ncbi:hypothetical protein Sango_1921400 [Sesamum angolense]|uniref:Calcineurin-like phosphoesterase domain-containing protein n=1 Tax=Sesamum angolense TaxID=2727404 RepID=A0AAE1WDQ3_9LAMI|nr:hypothetical protein Sango_1921400 [Sesamum angolense]